MAKKMYATVELTQEDLKEKLADIVEDMRNRSTLFSERVGADRARVDFNEEVLRYMEIEANRIDFVSDGPIDLTSVSFTKRNNLDLSALGIESILDGANAKAFSKSIEELRREVGLAFPMAEGKSAVDPTSVQYDKHLLGAIGSVPDVEKGETHLPEWPDALAELIGRGGISKQELAFVIDGINASRTSGDYEIAREHVDTFGNVDVLDDVDGIRRQHSTSSARHKEMLEKAEALAKSTFKDFDEGIDALEAMA